MRIAKIFNVNDRIAAIVPKGRAMMREPKQKSDLFAEHDSSQNNKDHGEDAYDEFLRAHESFLARNTTSAEDADARIRETEEWDRAVYDMAHPVRHAPRDLDINWFE